MPRDGAGCDKNISIRGMKVTRKRRPFSRLGVQDGRKKRANYGLALRSTTNCDFIPLLIPAQLRSPRPSFNPWPSPIHSSTKAFDSGQFFSPDFVEIYEPPRSDGLPDSLGGRASRPVRKIVPYVYLKPYTRRMLLVTSLISVIDIPPLSDSDVSREFVMGRVKLAVNAVYKVLRILRYQAAIRTTNKWLLWIELKSRNLAFRVYVEK